MIKKIMRINNFSLIKVFHFLFVFIIVLSSCKNKSKLVLKSPDGNITVIVKQNREAENTISYSVDDRGESIIVESPVGLEFKRTGLFLNNLEIDSVTELSFNDSWKPVYGEKRAYVDNFNETTFRVKESIAPYRYVTMTFRVYNEGMAFRYSVNSADSITILKELSGFKLTKDNLAWVTKDAQGTYKKMPVSKIKESSETPLVIELDNRTIALGEAALVDYAKVKIQISVTDSLMLTYSMVGDASFNQFLSTPWRYVMIADSPNELLENNYFILNLNEPNEIKNTTWIKPGKVIREVTLTTKGAKASIDFAAKHNLQYIEFDAGWYGYEYDDSSDATTVTVDPNRSPGPLDLPEVIRYADKKNIGVLLYVNGKALEKQLDEILPLFKSWGIKGVKYGFVNVGSQKWTEWLHDAVRKAAKYQLMVDIHDSYRPTGYSRTYPNLMTQEGIRGDEESPTVEHSIITFYTRMIAGAGDNTNCYLATRVYEKMGGKTAQMAKTILLYSPWQFIYWYDRPEGSPYKKGGAGLTKGIIQEDDALSFYDALPTVWDDTKILGGDIGEYAIVARKSGKTWFVGALVAKQERRIKIPLEFLDEDENYEATIYFQNLNDLKENEVQIAKKIVDSNTILSKKLEANSGIVVIIRKL